MAMERLLTTLLPESSLGDAAAVKACCADLYDHQLVRWLLGDVLHPGGDVLTRRLAGLIGLSGGLVLDVATGDGHTPRLLSQEFGHRCVGIDLRLEGLKRLTPMIDFQAIVADAEHLPFALGAFDAIVCECSFCLFPDKEAAAGEFWRVLKSGGRLGISDVTLNTGDLREEYRGLLSWAACLADAKPVEEYLGLLQRAGFRPLYVEEHNEALAEILATVQQRLGLAEVMVKLGRAHPKLATLGEVALELVADGKNLMEQADTLLRQGRLGYCLLVLARD